MSRLDTYERFDSSEDVEPGHHKAIFREGAEARCFEQPHSANPYKGRGLPGWLVRSWYAGWEDADMGFLEEIDAKRQTDETTL